MTSIPDSGPRRIVVGVDTHKDAHVAVALDQLGGRLGEITISVDRAGYAQLEHWAHQHGEKIRFGIEGTGSYGAGLASFLRRRGHQVVEVNRPDRRIRHLHGKTDPLDAEAAARAVLAGTATAVPKSADGTVEMIRQVKIAKDTAVKARSQAIITLKTIMVTAPADLREQLEPLGDVQLLDRCRALSYDAMSGPGDATRYTLRALAERYHDLDREVRLHDRVLQTLTQRAAPELTSRFGIGADSAAELLLIVGITPSASATRQHWPSWPAPAPSRHPPARPPATGSTAADTARPTPRCTASSSPGCGSTNPLLTMCPGVPPRARPNARSCAA